MPNMQPITAFSRYEHIDNITFAENTTQTLPTNGGLLPNDRFISGLILEFRGRLTMPAATGPSAQRAETVAQIIERVTVEGYHKVRRQSEKFFDLRGSQILRKQLIYLPGGLVNALPTITVTANATNDMIFQLFVPFTPLRMPVEVQAGYLLDAPNYESLKLTVQWGDFKSLVVPGATNATWSAYGSASGSPTLRVAGEFAIQPARFANFVPGRIWQYFTEITGSPVTTTNTQTRLYDIPKGFDIRSLILQTGTKATDATAGNNAYQTLTDYLTDFRINVGMGRPIRRYLDGNGIQADIASSYNLAARTVGINPIDFAQYGRPGEVFGTRSMVTGPTGNVDFYLTADVTGNANQALSVCLEEWRYRPTGA